MPFTRGAGLLRSGRRAAAETLEQRLRIPTGQFQHAAVGVAGRVGGTAASPPRSSMGERRKWRPVRRARAADEKNDFRNVNIGVLRLFVFVPRSVRGRIPGNGATAKKDAARELFLGDTDDRLRAGTGVRPRPAGAGRRSAAYGRVQAPEQCCRCPDRVKRAGRGKRKGKRAEESVPADRADAGSAGRGFSAAGSVRTRCVWPVGSQGVDGSDRHAGARGRNRGSGSKALGMISPVG